jgi:hypothetical protein
MRLAFPVILILTVASAMAQTVPNPWFYQPLGQVQQYLQLTDVQLQGILSNNGEYNQFALTKQNRISQLQTEIASETAKDALDPMALGVRYAEIESICREMKDQAATYQQKNTGVLTDPQKAKLQVLQEALKLAPVISDAQSGNLLGRSTYAPPFFTSTSGGSIGSVIGGVLGPVSGCYSPVPTAIVRSGDFSAAPSGTHRATSGTPQKWFDRAESNQSK